MKKKSRIAYKTIGEAAVEIGLFNRKNNKPNTHTLRFWEIQVNKKHKCIEIDLFAIKEIKNKVIEIKKYVNKIDIIIHIAGGGLGINSYLPSHENYMKVFNLNLFSFFEINRELAPLLKKNKYSMIFHIGSIASNEAAGSLSYNVSKSSLSSYVRSLSKDLAKYNICVTGINPGSFIYNNNAMHRLKKRNLNFFKKFVKENIPSKKYQMQKN